MNIADSDALHSYLDAIAGADAAVETPLASIKAIAKCSDIFIIPTLRTTSKMHSVMIGDTTSFIIATPYNLLFDIMFLIDNLLSSYPKTIIESGTVNDAKYDVYVISVPKYEPKSNARIIKPNNAHTITGEIKSRLERLCPRSVERMDTPTVSKRIVLRTLNTDT